MQTDDGRRLGEILVDLGMLTEAGVAEAVAEQAGLTVVDLDRTPPDAALAAELPESRARALGAVPVERQADGALVVAVADPAPGTLEQLRAAVTGPVVVRVAPAGQLRRVLDATYRALAGVSEQVAAFEVGRTGATTQALAHRGELGAEGDDAPVVQVVDMILTQALRDRASDVHVEPQDGRVRVRYRIDGSLHEVLALPGAMGPAVASRLKIMAGMNIVERRRPQDGQISTTIDGRPVDVRVATAGTVWGEKVVLRVLDKGRALYRLRDLGMPERDARGVRAPDPRRRSGWSSAPARPAAARRRPSTRRCRRSTVATATS